MQSKSLPVTKAAKKSETQTTKKNKGKTAVARSLHLELPERFDGQVDKVAAVADHFTLHYDPNEATTLYREPVTYTPSRQELDKITDVLNKVIADPATSGLSVSEIHRNYIATNTSLGAYKGKAWNQYFVEELNRIRHQPTPPLPRPSLSTVDPADKGALIRQEFKKHGVCNAELITFVTDLSRLVRDDTRSVFLLVDQWRRVLKVSSSHWCPPPLWWCVGSTLVGDNLIGMTRPCKEGSAVMAATCLENWDIFTLLKLLQSNIFPDTVRKAAYNVKKYTRTDLAHERFDCDFRRDWGSMADLLNALDCPSAAAELREFCEPKTHNSDGGESCGFGLHNERRTRLMIA